MKFKENYLNNFFFRELIVFFSMFILTTLHEWIIINDLIAFLKAVVFFIIIYIQAQVNRVYMFKFFLKKKLEFYILTILTILFSAFILFIFNFYWIQPEYYQKANILTSLLYLIVLCIVNTLVFISLSLMRLYYMEIKQKYNDYMVINEMKIKFLYSQLNPHFYFNILNSLYGVSITNSTKTPSLILKLSNLTRYQLESSKRKEVELSEELDFINSYITFEKERIGPRCKVTFDYAIDEKKLKDYRIAPLLIISIIENSFKHSVKRTDWFVSISISMEKMWLTVNIENSISDLYLHKNSTGIGLKNLKERLEILYKNSYEIIYIENDITYSTILKLKLSKYG
ncbi:TPA: sensor histidine kinase [Elizabethkingia anophelis]